MSFATAATFKHLLITKLLKTSASEKSQRAVEYMKNGVEIYAR